MIWKPPPLSMIAVGLGIPAGSSRTSRSIRSRSAAMSSPARGSMSTCRYSTEAMSVRAAFWSSALRSGFRL